jgi:lipopolysaccharide transport system permease protein
MGTQFSDISTEPHDGGVRVAFRMRTRGVRQNDGSAPVLGFQVLDPVTGCYLQDGEHRPLPASTQTQQHEILLEPSLLPVGRLRVVISLLDGRGWSYRRGDDYLQLEIDNSGDALKLHHTKVSSLGREAIPRLLRSVAKAFTMPAASIVRNHRLILTMVRRDLMGRYRGSTAGILWSILNPLLMMITYYFVFGVVLQARFAGDPTREGFVLYFLAGMLPWLPFSEAVGRAPAVLLEHGNFIKKLVFPIETLPANLVASGLVLQGIAIVIFLIGLLFFRGAIPLTAFWVPVLLVPQMLFTMGLCWLFSALGLLFRDLAQITGYFLTMWFFLTPICYPEEGLPAAIAPYMALNPIFTLVRAYRTVLLQGTAPDFVALAQLMVIALVTFVAGHALFHKLRRSFADLL